jgi:hypothetical protein
MSWNVSKRNVKRQDVNAEIDAMTATQPNTTTPLQQEQVAYQIDKARAAAKVLAAAVDPVFTEINISLSGHVHTGQDAFDSVYVSISGAAKG